MKVNPLKWAFDGTGPMMVQRGRREVWKTVGDDGGVEEEEGGVGQGGGGEGTK